MSTTSRHTKKELSKAQKKAMISGIREQQDKRPFKDDWRDQEGFNVAALGDWIELCEQTAIAHVPAERIATIEIGHLLTRDENDPVLQQFASDIMQARKPNTMFRWCCCAPHIVKLELSKGLADWNPDFLAVDLTYLEYDARAYELVYEFPAREISVWKRPWIQAIEKDGYPVEYRAYVKNGKIVGVSNYYVQRPLEWKNDIEADVNFVIFRTKRILDALKPPVRYPFAGYLTAKGSGEISFDKPSFTVDFMKTPQDIMFLEGGPPIESGAHPCCFEHDYKNMPGDQEVMGIPIALESKVDHNYTA